MRSRYILTCSEDSEIFADRDKEKISVSSGAEPHFRGGPAWMYWATGPTRKSKRTATWRLSAMGWGCCSVWPPPCVEPVIFFFKRFSGLYGGHSLVSWDFFFLCDNHHHLFSRAPTTWSWGLPWIYLFRKCHKTTPYLKDTPFHSICFQG